MNLTLNSDLSYQVHEDGAEPLVFQPQVDWETFEEPNIIGAY